MVWNLRMRALMACAVVVVGCQGGVTTPYIGTVSDATIAAEDVSDADGLASAKDTATSIDSDTATSGDGVDASCLTSNGCAAKGQVCNPLSGQCVGCIGPEQCAKGQSCIDNQCVGDGSCSGQAPKCADANVALVCDALTLQWLASPCTDGSTCVAGSCVPPSGCTPGAKTCVGQQVYGCSPDGKTSVLLQDCGMQGDSCKAGACVAPLCTTGPNPACQGNNVVTCTADGLLSTITYCGNAYCIGGSCVSSPCPPGGVGCSGNQAMACDAAGQSKMVEDCGAKGQVCSMGACLPKICNPGEMTCQGKKVANCDATGAQLTVVNDCAQLGPTAYCAGGNCLLPPCAPGALGCQGTTLVQCSDTGVQVVQACASEGKTCINAACVPMVCTPNKPSCDGNKMGYCNSLGSKLYIEDDCAQMGKICSAGKCIKQPCTPGNTGCVGAKFVQCDAASFSVVQDCALTGELCSASGCQPPICQAGQVTCDANKVVTCAGGASWQTLSDCSTSGQLCKYNKCVPLPCTAGGTGCDDGKVVQCGASTTSWTVLQDCAAQGLICNAGACKKALCDPGMPLCQGNQGMACDDSGASIGPGYGDCSSQGKTCMSGMCVSSLCSPGASGCVGAQTAKCSANGMGWTQTPCAAGTVCSAGTCQTPTCALPKSYGPDAVWLHWGGSILAQGCDLNGDGQPDNALGDMAGLLLSGGQGPFPGPTPFLLTLAATGLNTTGKPFDLDVLPIVPAAGGFGCDAFLPVSQKCSGLVEPTAYATGSSGPCQAKGHLTNATLIGTALTAGGASASVDLPIAAPPTPLYVTLKGARIEAQVPASSPWQSASSGRLCGWVTKADLQKTLDALPAAALEQPGTTPQMIKDQILSSFQPDIDSDSDGKPDVYSAFLPFSGQPVSLAPAGL